MTPVDGGHISFIAVDSKGANADAEIQGANTPLIRSRAPASASTKFASFGTKKTGKQIPGSDGPDLIDETVQVVPKKFSEQSAEKVEIKAGANTFNYDLKSDPKSSKSVRKSD